MKVKGRKSYKNKTPSPCRQNWMLCAIICCQNTIIRRSTRFKWSLLHFNKLDIDINHLLTKSEYDDHSSINFPLQFAFNQVNSTTNQLNAVVLTEVVLRPTEKPRGCRPTQINIKENKKQKEITTKNNKLRSVSKPLCSGSVDLDSDDDIVLQRFTYGGSVNSSYDGGENNIPQQSIFYTKKDMRTYPFMDNGKPIPIVTWKLTKNCSHIISDISIPG